MPRALQHEAILRALHLISLAVPSDTEPTLAWRTSEKGILNLRVAASTAGRTWVADLYSQRFLRLSVGDTSEVCHSPEELVRALRRYLNV